MPSSVVMAMEYAPQRHELLIVFRGNRGIYRYFDVAAEEWLAFREAPSKGTHLNRIFKASHPHYEHIVASAARTRARPNRRGNQIDPAADSERDELRWGETWALPR
jgi:hypothetical protein